MVNCNKGCDMMIAIIAAYDKNRLIGKGGGMPWYIPGELKRFRRLTENNVVIMGRKTYLSLGKPLADRVNIIISRNENFAPDGCYTTSSITGAIAMARLFWPDKDIFIGGGAQIYSQTIEMADVLYITEIDGEFEGDTYFPDFDESVFTKEIESHHESTVPYTYVTYKRK
ncbi:MAG: dihydrofolate reductase [Oscillospiraceae bacterium]|nr:dihydrofolate reductase [Oscillospiraceae bacterium]